MKTIKNLTLLLFLLTVFACKKEQEVSPTVQDIKELVFASGQLEWDDAYNLTAQTDGILQNAAFEVGDTIQKGKILAQIDNKNNEINTQTAQEQLLITNENLTANSPALQQLAQNIEFAENKYTQDKTQADRYERLYKSESISKLEYENVQLTAKNSLANLNALKKQYDQIWQQAKQQNITAKSQVRNSQIIQNYNQIVVPENGTVIKKLKTNGDYVRKGDVIATLANAKKIEAVLNVDENSIAKIKIGQEVFVQLNTNKNTIYKGKVAEILAAFDEKTQSFICKVSFDEPLQASFFGTQLEANILVGEKKNALLVPRTYVGFGNKVNEKGKEKPTIIQTGIISTEYVEVLSGIDKNAILLPLKP